MSIEQPQLGPEFVLQEARDLLKFYESHDPPKPYTAGVLTDCIEMIERLRGSADARPISEYHDDMGDVLWWKFPIEEPPYVGSPNNLGFTVEADISICLRTHADPAGVDGTTTIRRDVGGWPGYHTHFTPIPIPTPVSRPQQNTPENKGD